MSIDIKCSSGSAVGLHSETEYKYNVYTADCQGSGE